MSTAVVFAVSGAVFATWVSRLVATRDRLDVGTGALGLALVAAAVGSLVSMPFTGRLCARWGSRRVVLATSLPACLTLASIAHVPTLPVLTITLGCWGFLYGAWDVAMNVHGSAVERRDGRDLMPRFHGCWSVGGIAGAGLGALAAHAGLSVPVHFAVAAGVAALTQLIALRGFVEDRSEVTAQPATGTDPAGAGKVEATARLFTPRLVALGLVTLCATCAEGAAADWLALYLADVRGATESAAAAGYTGFAVAMALTRFAGTGLIARLGRAGAVRLAGVLTALGVALTLLGPGLIGAYAAAVLWGMGVAVVFPAAMSAAGEVPGRSSDAIAAVSTIGYGGFLLGPPLIGFVAEVTGLGRALWVLTFLGTGMALLATAARSAATLGVSPR